MEAAPPSVADFDSTQWSLVLAAPHDPAALERLLAAYWRPIYAFILGSGRGRDEAIDLTQEFISTVVLERGFVERADPERGRFRTFVKSALRNFLVDEHRRATTRTRSAPGVRLDAAALDEVRGDPADPSRSFDQEWAASVLSAALARVERDCAGCGQAAHWHVFRRVVIEPALRQVEAPPLAGVAAEAGVAGADQAASMIQTVRRKFRREFQDLVSRTVCDGPARDLEVEELRAILGM
jgi:RNA polymerase sigma-70 factor (ECF subfamily)